MYLHWNCRKHLHSLCHKLGRQKERCWNALTPKNDNNLCTWVPKLTAAYHIHNSEWKQVVWWCLVVATIVSNKKQVFVVFGGFPLYTGKHLDNAPWSCSWLCPFGLLTYIYTGKHLDNTPWSSSWLCPFGLTRQLISILKCTLIVHLEVALWLYPFGLMRLGLGLTVLLDLSPAQ
jgi:hypothetical protein